MYSRGELSELVLDLKSQRQIYIRPMSQIYYVLPVVNVGLEVCCQVPGRADVVLLALAKARHEGARGLGRGGRGGVSVQS